jgi:hypothetical protein
MTDDEQDRTIPPLPEEGSDMTDEQYARQATQPEQGGLGAGTEQPEGTDHMKDAPPISDRDQVKGQTQHPAPEGDVGHAGTDKT